MQIETFDKLTHLHAQEISFIQVSAELIFLNQIIISKTTL